jgi:predicted O-methyltransferase YrrM
VTTSYEVADKTTLMSRGEIDLMKKYVAKLPKNPIVIIIGAGSGTSSLAILEERNDATVFSIDTVFPTTHRYTPGEKENLRSAGIWETGRVIQVIGKSQIIGKTWPYEYDMIFIDGDHRYEFVKPDIELWIPKAKQDAVIMFHDYAERSIKPKAGVKRAVDELLLDDWNKVGYERFLLVMERKTE